MHYIKTCTVHIFEQSCLIYEPAGLYVIVVQAALPECGNFNALLSVFSVRQLSPRFFGQANKKNSGTMEIIGFFEKSSL